MEMIHGDERDACEIQIRLNFGGEAVLVLQYGLRLALC